MGPQRVHDGIVGGQRERVDSIHSAGEPDVGQRVGTVGAVMSEDLEHALAGGALTPGNLTLDLPFAASTLPVPPGTSTTSSPVVLDFSSSTQFGTAFGVTAASQNGNAPGSLTGFGIGGNGMVQARYSNGQTVNAAQIALADFRNEQGLLPSGDNLWRATPDSGPAALSAPGTANLGQLQGGALEESNVDLTQQLVDMITAQRSYQANAQTIKTQDQMLSTLVNLR